ncbi:MAG: hypothetical protein RMJ44_05690 [Cytophagales bacterium]|nr:hypothetical protein [Cytophagales bacterium]
MKCISLFASCFSILFPHALLAQDIVNDFSYAGVTYRYKIAPQEGRDSTYLLHIQALKNDIKGLTSTKGALLPLFKTLNVGK